MKKILFTLILFSGMLLSGQDLQNFYSYSLDWTNINNAYVGVDRSINTLVMTRSQFGAVANSPNNVIALIHAGISETQGVGIKMINDSRGVFSTTRFDAVYSQRFNFNEQNYIRFGLSFGALNSNIDLSKLSNGDVTMESGDPVPASSLYNYTYFTSGFGMVAGVRQFELGVSAPHMVLSDGSLEPFIFTTLSYRYDTPGPITLIPAVIYQNKPEQDNVVDGFITVDWREQVQVITGYTSDNRLRLGAGINYKNLGISYINENPTGAQTIANSANEIAVRLKIGQGKKAPVDVRSEIQKLLDETAAMLGGDYDRAYLKKRLAEIDRQLDSLLSKNTGENAREVDNSLNELERQLLLIIEKYDLTNE